MEDRFYPCETPVFYCCSTNFSFYRFIEDLCKSQTTERTLHRVFSLMRKMNIQTMIQEKLEPKGELEIELNAIKKRIGNELKSFDAFSAA